MDRKPRFNMNVPSTIRFNLLDQQFGKLTVVGFGGHKQYGSFRAISWTCRCECGSVGDYLSGNLRSGISISCRKCGLERTHLAGVTHGQTGTPTYN